jgi:hypothetical protein
MRKHTLRLLASALLVSIPSLAACMGTISIDDVVAGYDTAATVAGAPAKSPIEVHVITPSGGDTSIPVMTDARGAAQTAIPSKLLNESGMYRIFGASGHTKVTGETTFSVISDGIDDTKSSMSVSDPFLKADGKSITVVSVILRDSLGSPLAGRPVQIVGSRIQDRISPAQNTRETDSSGRVRFAVQTMSPGEIVLRAMDLISGKVLRSSVHIEAVEDTGMGGFASPYSAQLTSDSDPSMQEETTQDFPTAAPTAASANNAGIVQSFVIEVSTPTVKVRDVLPLVTIKAVDAAGNVVPSFTGTVTIATPNDKNSTLPGYFDDGTGVPRVGKVTFAGKNRGVFPLAWSLSFTKSGEQSIIVSDESGTITGQTSVTVTGTGVIPAGKQIMIESPKDGDTVNSVDIVVKGKGPVLSNLNVWAKPAGTPPEEVASGEPTATGDTGSKGSFEIPLTIPNTGDVVYQIQDESAQYDSGVITIHLDSDGPGVTYSTDPANPREGEAMTFIVKTEAGLPSVTLSMNDQTFALTEIDSGEYQVPIMAPKSGSNAFVIEAQDAAGNVTSVNGSLNISGPDLPQVQNVQTKPVAGGIEVSWDRIPDETITSYRIEVGKSPNVVDFPLDTPQPTDSAAVMGLKAGIDYFLVVRALRGDQVGPPSTMVSARTLGIELTVTGQDDSLLLQWTFPDSTPLSSFTLEYGPGEEFYSEKRTLEGGMRVYTIPNLLPQPYFVKLTPIAVNGQTLTELAVTGTGTPTAGAFHASADDALGQRPNDVPPSNDLHEGAPTVTSSGLPPIPLWLVSALTVVAGTAYLIRRKRKLRETEVFLRRMRDTYRQ